MNKLTKLVLATTLLLPLSACGLLAPAVDIGASTILASSEVDKLQDELSPYVDNKEALRALDELQEDIQYTATTGGDVLFIEQYQLRAEFIYSELAKEVSLRMSELSEDQIARLVALDKDLKAINAAIASLKTSASFAEEAYDLIYKTTVLMTYFKGL